MLWFHPLLQLAAILLSFYVLRLGIARFKSQHLHQRQPFGWKLHVRLGEVVMIIWLLGMAGGFFMVRYIWHAAFITGMHARIAILMLPLILIGLGSGIYLDRYKKRRLVLPLVHAINNLVLLVLAVMQIFFGLGVLWTYVFGL
ncbi:MAG: DUF4079 domain-containing protein [Deltaproteobacteria bacterium]|nr:DUF4079 domain-containing protein [Candidatus Tharpellaceae bacterium]